MINDHKAHKKLIQALDAGDSETVLNISHSLESYNIELLNILVSSLEGGQYYYVTKREVDKGRSYLSQQNNSAPLQ